MHSGNFRLPQTGSFALAEGMVRFQLDFTDITQGIRQLPDSGQMFNAVIDAGNQGAAQNYVSSRPADEDSPESVRPERRLAADDLSDRL